jgi:uncharacterized protein (TIGR01244 family)
LALAGLAPPPALLAAEAQAQTAPAQAAPPPAAAAEELLPDARQPLPHLLTGGQPSAAQLEAIAAAGYRTVIDLRPEGEQGAPPDEPERVAALGMRYVRIPVAGAGDLTAENLRALDELLDQEAAYPAVVHCASGNRVGALLALRAARLDGAPPEAALELGLDAGLTRLEPAVRELLGLPPAPAEPVP